ILASNNQPRMVEALVGRVQIGELGGPNNHVELAAAAPHFTAQSDVTIHSTANFTLYPSSSIAVSVGGNFIDYGAEDATNYGAGVIAFFNNPATPRTVSIARSLVNDFRVGDNGSDFGGLPSNTP